MEAITKVSLQCFAQLNALLCLDYQNTPMRLYMIKHIVNL
jgi:hypothetical protein